MANKFLFTLCVIMGLSTFMLFLFKYPNSNKVAYDLTTNPVDYMPLVEDDPYADEAHGGAPQEQRGVDFNRWLSNGLRINVKNASGSGTIIYHDIETGWAYIQSCGHLWEGNMNAEECARRGITCSVTTWYHNTNKLPQIREYKAQVLYYSNSRGRDISLLKFRPDWEPEYLPIAPEGWEYSRGERLHSVGCDGGREVAHYDVEVVGLRDGDWPDLVTTRNSPRPGRSGGGLCDEEFYVGVCWGTSNYDGGGNGYFTPLNTVREYNKRNGYGWLNDINESLARDIPIRDRNNPQGRYPKNYIPLPIRSK